MKPPNVLLIFTDQQRYDTVHALGNPVIRTPSLDRLCDEGTAFTSAYTPSPVCVPARCSLHYGQYPAHTGCYENRYGMPTDGRPSFMDVLTGEGYRTHAVGKCHFRPDPGALRGFQTRERQGKPPSSDYLDHLHKQGFGHVSEPNGIKGEMYYVPQPAQMPASVHPTQWVADRSIAFIEAQAGREEPWFLFSSYVQPHPPFCPPVPWNKLYRATLMPLPEQPAQTGALLTNINRYQNRYKYRDQGTDLNLLRCMKAYYYGCISFIDFQVGRILEALEKTGELDRTLVLFTSDHGEYLGDYACFGKRSMHDASARVPLIARQPGVFEAGRRCDVPVSLVDVAPALLAAAGLGDGGMPLDGVNLAQTAAGGTERDVVFSQIERGGLATYMAVGERWKYFYSAPDGREFLFDRLNDPRETRNRAGVAFCRDALREMRARLQDHLRRVGETDGIEGDGWKVYPPRAVPEDPDTGLLIQDPPPDTMRIAGYSE